MCIIGDEWRKKKMPSTEEQCSDHFDLETFYFLLEKKVVPTPHLLPLFALSIVLELTVFYCSVTCLNIRFLVATWSGPLNCLCQLWMVYSRRQKSTQNQEAPRFLSLWFLEGVDVLPCEVQEKGERPGTGNAGKKAGPEVSKP